MFYLVSRKEEVNLKKKKKDSSREPEQAPQVEYYDGTEYLIEKMTVKDSLAIQYFINFLSKVTGVYRIRLEASQDRKNIYISIYTGSFESFPTESRNSIRFEYEKIRNLSTLEINYETRSII